MVQGPLPGYPQNRREKRGNALTTQRFQIWRMRGFGEGPREMRPPGPHPFSRRRREEHLQPLDDLVHIAFEEHREVEVERLGHCGLIRPLEVAAHTGDYRIDHLGTRQATVAGAEEREQDATTLAASGRGDALLLSVLLSAGGRYDAVAVVQVRERTQAGAHAARDIARVLQRRDAPLGDHRLHRGNVHDVARLQVSREVAVRRAGARDESLAGLYRTRAIAHL